MEPKKNAYRIFVAKTEGRRSLGIDWIHLAQDMGGELL
jgi:hypothetical protein